MYSIVKTVNFGPDNAGLGTVGYTLSGGSRSTTGVTETAPGIYAVTLSLADDFSGTLVWDTGGAGPKYANEDIAQMRLGPEGLDAIPMTLSGVPVTFREWLVWLTLRFRRAHKNKLTGVITTFGPDQATAVTQQSSTNTGAEQTVGVVQ